MLKNQVSSLIKHSYLRGINRNGNDKILEIFEGVSSKITCLLGTNLPRENIDDSLSDLPEFYISGNGFNGNEAEKYKFCITLEKFINHNLNISDLTLDLKKSLSKGKILLNLEGYYYEYKDLLEELKSNLKTLKDSKNLYNLGIGGYETILIKIKNNITSLEKKFDNIEKNILVHLNALNNILISKFFEKKAFDLNGGSNAIDSIFSERFIIESEIKEIVLSLEKNLEKSNSMKSNYSTGVSIYGIVPEVIFERVSSELDKIIKFAGNSYDKLILKKKCFLFINEISELFKKFQTKNEISKGIFDIYKRLSISQEDRELFKPIVSLYFENLRTSNQTKKVDNKASLFNNLKTFTSRRVKNLFGFGGKNINDDELFATT